MIQTLGAPLQLGAKVAELSTRIATVFPRDKVIVTCPGIHATQRQAYTDQLSHARVAQGLPPLTDAEELACWMESVPLILEPNAVLIRPDSERMDLAFETDSLLQTFISKRLIRFLSVNEPSVRDAIARRGEAWRINPLPRSIEEMTALIRSARIAVGGLPIYYYNAVRGTRILTCGSFRELGNKPDDVLRAHMGEIAGLSAARNSGGYRELELFMVQGKMAPSEFDILPGPDASPAELRRVYQDLLARFEKAVAPNFRTDDITYVTWRNRMYATLIDQPDHELSDQDLLGLGAEFFMQIQWLPGARTEQGELIFDSVADETPAKPSPQEMTVRGLIGNLMQECCDLEFVNIGRIMASVCNRPPMPGRREVYVAHFRERGQRQDTLQIIRMQKWGVWEHLDEGKDLLQAMIESEENTDYTMDRRLACRQLGMNLAPRVWSRKVTERYEGTQHALRGTTIWSPYFQRGFIAGFATDKIPPARMHAPGYAAALATVLGRAAAINIIVGRTDMEGRVIFDDGDEVVVEDKNGLPAKIVVADHTGTFNNYVGELIKITPSYAKSVNRRAENLPDALEFGRCFLAGFLGRFTEVQTEYRSRRSIFDGLFKHRPIHPGGNLAFRWIKVLERLNQADPERLAGGIREHIEGL